jgi:pathogenesis-related protein 1
MKNLFILLTLFTFTNCIQNIMECPSDLLKSECKSTETRKKNSQNMVLLGLGIASKSGVSFSAGSTTTSTTTSPTSSTNSAAEATSVSGITNEHNKLRAQENASLPNLTWDATVADYALRKVTFLANSNNCTMSHTAGPTNPGYGENLAWSSASSYTAVAATNAWYDEKPNYTYSTNTCASGKVCGHYTQVVWKNSTKIGCAGVVCSNGGGIIYGCNYDPPGNYSGQKPY